MKPAGKQLCFRGGKGSWPVEFSREGSDRRSFQEQLYEKIVCVSWKECSLTQDACVAREVSFLEGSE